MARSTPHVVSGQQVAAASPREVGAPAENEAPSEQSPGLFDLDMAQALFGPRPEPIILPWRGTLIECSDAHLFLFGVVPEYQSTLES